MSLSINKSSLLIQIHCMNLSPSPSRLCCFDFLIWVGDVALFFGIVFYSCSEREQNLPLKARFTTSIPFSLARWHEDKENAVLIGPNWPISPKMCSVEWKLWVWRWKMSWCFKMSCNFKTIEPFTSILCFPCKLTWRQRECCFDRSKWADLAEDVLCWVEVVGVNVKDELMPQIKL